MQFSLFPYRSYFYRQTPEGILKIYHRSGFRQNRSLCDDFLHFRKSVLELCYTY